MINKLIFKEMEGGFKSDLLPNDVIFSKLHLVQKCKEGNFL